MAGAERVTPILTVPGHALAARAAERKAGGRLTPAGKGRKISLQVLDRLGLTLAERGHLYDASSKRQTAGANAA